MNSYPDEHFPKSKVLPIVNIFNNEGKGNKEIEIRIAQAKSMFIKLNDIFMSRDISLDLRLRGINLYVYSVLLYGDETTKKLEVDIQTLGKS